MELLRRGDLSLAELALACGYYDQPHVNRESRAFAGTSPAQLARRLAPEGDVLAEPLAGDAV